MKSNSQLTRKLTVAVATTALAATLATPAHADRDWLPGGAKAFPAVTSSVRPDDRAIRPGRPAAETSSVAVTSVTRSILANDRAHHPNLPIASTSSVRPDDRRDRAMPPTGSREDAVAAGTPAGGDVQVDGSDVLILFLVALGLLALATVYGNRRFRPST
jgi:hypothetical protein